MAWEPNSSRVVSIGLLMTGVLLMGINQIAMLLTDYWFPKLMMIGIAVTCLAVMMLIFPPADFHITDSSAFFKETFKRTKKLNMMMWVVSLIISLFIIIWYVDYNQLNLT